MMAIVGGAYGGFFGGVASALGFSGGGYTGAGGVHEPAGVVHRGEVVFSQDDVARNGGVGAVEAMRRGKPGYARGGPVGLVPAALPPLVPPSLPSAGAALGGGSVNQVVNISTPITVNASGGTPEQNDDLAKRMAKEADGTIRNIVVHELRQQLRPGAMLNRGR
jgi:lambda family phage tail tape measure protein